ncbi:MAG: hypothetical protein PHU46_03340 [Rhodocyclaceae bacterium]|nr:hypothetical protein [Rhodocyclaceae bacterium]
MSETKTPAAKAASRKRAAVKAVDTTAPATDTPSAVAEAPAQEAAAPVATTESKTEKAPKAAKAATAKKPIRHVAPIVAEAPAKASKPAKTVKPAKAEKAPKPEKPAKVKLVRDSFTMPESDYGHLALLKQRCLEAGVAAKKSELLRLGLQVLATLPSSDLAQRIEALEKLKTGRPAKP